MRERCSATGKIMFETKGEANESMVAIKSGQNHMRYVGSTLKRIKRRQGKTSQKRAYLCEHCDNWHLTSWETSNKMK